MRLWASKNPCEISHTIVCLVPASGSDKHIWRMTDWMSRCCPDSLPSIAVGRTILTLFPCSTSAPIKTKMPWHARRLEETPAALLTCSSHERMGALPDGWAAESFLHSPFITEGGWRPTSALPLLTLCLTGPGAGQVPSGWVYLGKFLLCRLPLVTCGPACLDGSCISISQSARKLEVRKSDLVS